MTISSSRDTLASTIADHVVTSQSGGDPDVVAYRQTLAEWEVLPGLTDRERRNGWAHVDCFLNDYDRLILRFCPDRMAERFADTDIAAGERTFNYGVTADPFDPFTIDGQMRLLEHIWGHEIIALSPDVPRYEAASFAVVATRATFPVLDETVGRTFDLDLD